MGVENVRVPTRVFSAFEREPNGVGVNGAAKFLARGLDGVAAAVVDVDGMFAVGRGAGEGVCGSAAWNRLYSARWDVPR